MTAQVAVKQFYWTQEREHEGYMACAQEGPQSSRVSLGPAQGLMCESKSF